SSSTSRTSSRSSSVHAGSSPPPCTVARTWSGVSPTRSAKKATCTPHSQAQPHRGGPAIEPAAGSDLVVDARYAGQRREERERRHAQRHDLVEHRLEVGGK